jgi:P-type conjugative transfer protein TrbJ
MRNGRHRTRSWPHRLTRGGAVLVVASGITLAPTMANAQFGSSIVYDPTAVAQLLNQVKNQVQILNSMVQQVQQGANMLQGLGTNLVPGLSGLMQQTRLLMNNLNGIQNLGANLPATLATSFPTDFSSLGNINAILGTVAPMLDQVRQAQEQSMSLQNQLANNIPQYSSAIQSGVDASNNAAGPTAAMQATNQILAAMSAQLSDVLAALIAHERAEEQRAMADQSLQQAQQAANESRFSQTPDYPIENVTNY